MAVSLSSPKILEHDNVSLTATVVSNPLSDITLYNMTEVLLTIEDTSTLHYTFYNMQCLNTGNYTTTASNDIPSEGHSVEKVMFVDVMCEYITVTSDGHSVEQVILINVMCKYSTVTSDGHSVV